MTPKEFIERVLDVVDENSGDNSLRAIYFRMISENKVELQGDKAGFRAALEAVDTVNDSFLEARMIVENELFRCRYYIRGYTTAGHSLTWIDEPTEAAKMLLRLYTIQNKREISYK